MPTIYTYEVELKLTNPNTKEQRLVTRLEHAYSVMDAVMQATFVAAQDAGSAAGDMKVVRVGPPIADIEAARKDLIAETGRVLSQILTQGRVPKKP